MNNLFIKNALIIDGTGKPAFEGGVCCNGGVIRVLPPGVDAEAEETIDAGGLCLCPGFIDSHSHGDLTLGTEWGTLAKISQGITTHAGGQCGLTLFPINPDSKVDVARSVGLKTENGTDLRQFSSFSGYLQYVATLKHAENIGFFVGHETLRLSAMGYDNRKPSKQEMDYMKEAIHEAMKNGAMGLTTGLIYTPGAYADIDELVELCTVVAQYDGIYATHMRNESDRVLSAMDEAIEIGRRSGCRVNISHLKICGRPFWGQAEAMLKKISDARAEGLRVSGDQYPYTASGTQLIFCIPPWHQEEGMDKLLEFIKTPEGRNIIRGEMTDEDCDFDNIYRGCGGFENILIGSCAVTKEADGLSVAQWAQKAGKEEFEAFFDLLVENTGSIGAIFFDIGEEDVLRIMADRDVMVCTDGGIENPEDSVHPRTFGSFPRAIDLFVRQRNLMPLESMIRKMTGLTAENMGFLRKGIIADGMDADLMLFNPKTIGDRADYINSKELSEGIEAVIVAGTVVYREKRLTGASPGKVVLYRK